jgi:hypothetical protein
MLVILPRYVPQWPPSGYLGCLEGNKSTSGLGAPGKPLPLLQTHSKPICAATIRSGPGYLEIPFVATHEGKRGRGYCRWSGGGAWVSAVNAYGPQAGWRG